MATHEHEHEHRTATPAGDAVTAHWLQGASRLPSPHQDARPAGVEPSLVILHGISLPPGRFGTGVVESLFLGQLPVPEQRAYPDLVGLRVSSHLFMRRDGSIAQFVPFDRRAWHAGRSAWRGRAGCNDFSIGIELEGMDLLPYADAQYDALARTLPALRAAYPGIVQDAIVGHEHVAPGRKTDPGPAFEWHRLR